MAKTTLTTAELLAYNAKFERFDNASEDEKKLLMYSDPSLFCYAVFRDIRGNRLKPYPFQDLILNDKAKFIAVGCSRQVGKTTLAMIKSFHYVFYHDNATVLVISKTLNQSKEMISKLRNLINSSPLREEFQELVTGSDNKSEYYLKNYGKDSQSRIISVPATDAARGFTSDLTIGDEIAFWENSEEMFNEAILPTVSATDGQIMMLSTPKGAIGVFYDAFTKEDVWSTYLFSWKECPHHTPEKIALIRRQLGDFAFRQEYEASFVANQAAYFKEKEVKDAISHEYVPINPSVPVVIGIDFGKVNDATIITIGYLEKLGEEPMCRITEIIEKPLGTEYNKIIGEIVSLSKKYNVKSIFYDQTGVGEGPGDFMKDVHLPTEGVKFSIQSKIDIYSNLKLLFEKRLIKIPDNKRLIDEALLFEYEYTTSGNMKLHHPEGGHDDSVDSLALCCYGLIRLQGITPGITSLESKPEEQEKKVEQVTEKTFDDQLLDEKAEASRLLSGREDYAF